MENQPPSLFNSGYSCEEELKITIGRQLQNKFNFFFNYVNIKLHTENQPPSLFNSGYSYKEDLKIRIWKTTSQYFQSFSIFVVFMLESS